MIKIMRGKYRGYVHIKTNETKTVEGLEIKNTNPFVITVKIV